MIGLRIIVFAFIATIISSTAHAQCPFGYFKIGPLSTNRSIGAGLPSQAVATGCIKVETTEQLATINAVVIADLSHAQALVDRIVTNLGSVTRKCAGLSTWRDFEIAISTATLESGIGTPHFTVVPTPTTLADSERALILRTLDAAGWVIGGRDGAAARLGLKRTTLIYKMQRHGISRPSLVSNLEMTGSSLQATRFVPQLQ